MDLQALLDAFPGYLEENRLAPARHIPFLTRWVERYLLRRSAGGAISAGAAGRLPQLPAGIGLRPPGGNAA